MNRIFLIIVFSFISCKSQAIYNLGTYDISEDNYYVKDLNNYHDTVIGTWKWEDGNSSFEITLQEFEKYSDVLTPTEYEDRLFGKYKYTKNGVVIVEVNQIVTLPDFKLTLIFQNPTKYSIFIRDTISETGKTGEFILTSPTTATLELWNSEGVKVNYGNGLDFALPTSLILIKQ